MPTWTWELSWTYAGWTALAFVLSFVPNSFIEWIAHRWVLHSKAIVKFAYEEHDQNHHKVYLADASYRTGGADYGVDFRFRDWFLFLVLIAPLWLGVEWLIGKPIAIGATMSAMLWLQMFNVVHRHFHAPNGSWIERTWYFKRLMEHHRKHHGNTATNYNVAFFPIADFFLGTYRR